MEEAIAATVRADIADMINHSRRMYPPHEKKPTYVPPVAAAAKAIIAKVRVVEAD